MPSRFCDPSEAATSLPSGPNRYIARSLVVLPPASSVHFTENRTRVSYRFDRSFGNVTRTWCWLFSSGCAGSQAPVGSSVPSWPQTRPELPLLKGALPCHDVVTRPGDDGTRISDGAVAGAEEALATRTAQVAARATPPARRRRR